MLCYFRSIYANNDQIFRDNRGSPNIQPGAGLRLQLEDFACGATVQPYGNLAHSLFIPSTVLCTFLDTATMRGSNIKRRIGNSVVLPAGVSKKPRERTPEPDSDSESEED